MVKSNNTNCSINSNFYKSVLSKSYGIGINPLTYKDLLMSYLGMNKVYLNNSCSLCVSGEIGLNDFVNSNSASSGPNGSTLVGIMVPINPDSTVNNNGKKPLEFFENDQAAYLGGYVKTDEYLLSKNNRYGLPEGLSKRITEEFGEE